MLLRELKRLLAGPRLAQVEAFVERELLDELAPQSDVVVDYQDDVGRVHDRPEFRPTAVSSAERATDRRRTQALRRMSLDLGATTAYGHSRE
jgi:hypothetical protein